MCTVERACATHLGVAQFGVHVNVLSGPPNQQPTHMWIAKRAPDKPTWPGMWDNCVGGGLAAGLTHLVLAALAVLAVVAIYGFNK